MRLFWKQFLATVAMVIGAFVLFGCVLIHASFKLSLNREEEQTLQTLQMYQYSMLASLENIPEDFKTVELTIADIAETVYQNLGHNTCIIAVYGDDGRVIYQSHEWQSKLILHKGKMNNGIRQITTEVGQHYLENIVKTESSVGTYYLEIDQNIEHIYESRQQLYNTYQKILVLVVCLTIAIAAVLTLRLTRPVKRLSVATRKFADGDYGSRVCETGNDEVTDLIRDFNSMADVLENNIEELKEAARRQEEFTGAFAHELKTPLTSIIGYSEALCSMELTEEEKVSSANYIFHQGKRLESLAYKMMELVGIKKQQWEFVPIDVTLLCSNVKQITDQIRKKKNISLTLQLEEGQVYGDMELLESLLSNLIDNARKASKDGSEVILYGVQVEKGYELSVIDHGCGIPQEEINKIHEAFYMVDKSRARKEGGAGIGMSLCEKILELHGGTWEIKSKVGEGTTVTLHFPEGMA